MYKGNLAKLNELDIDWDNVEISVDVSTSDEDYDHRIFAKPVGYFIVTPENKITILCEMVSDNYKGEVKCNMKKKTVK